MECGNEIQLTTTHHTGKKPKIKIDKVFKQKPVTKEKEKASKLFGVDIK